MEIVETKKVFLYLEKRQLISQYKKAKNYLKSGSSKKVDFKKRKPKSEEIWYFRINKQFRALAYFDENRLVVFKIDDHQK